MTDVIRMSAPDIDEIDEAAILQVLRSGVLSLGPFSDRSRPWDRSRRRSAGPIVHLKGKCERHHVRGRDAGSS